MKLHKILLMLLACFTTFVNADNSTKNSVSKDSKKSLSTTATKKKTDDPFADIVDFSDLKKAEA